jgi:hypothetical protein
VFRRLVLVGMACTGLAGCYTAQADLSGRVAQESYATLPEKGTAERRASKPAGKGGAYFVEFRSRYALSYGHTFLVYGQLTPKGELPPLSAENVAGFHPAGEGPELWTAGHIVPVQSETGPSDGDLEEEYVSARYRVYLKEPDFRKVAAFIKQRQKITTMWHAALYNCNAWVGDIARSMGLRVPLNTLQYPASFITELRNLNSGETAAVEAPAAVTAWDPQAR